MAKFINGVKFVLWLPILIGLAPIAVWGITRYFREAAKAEEKACKEFLASL